jgi:hypothetical protein
MSCGKIIKFSPSKTGTENRSQEVEPNHVSWIHRALVQMKTGHWVVVLKGE